MKIVVTSLMAIGLALPVCAETFDVGYGTRKKDVPEFMLTVGSYRSTGLAADEKRELPSVAEPPTRNGDPAIHFGAPMDANRIGLWSERNSYGLHHLPNMWTVFEGKGKQLLPPIAGYDPSKSTLRDSVLIVTHPDGSVSKESVSWPADGPAGGGWRGGIGGLLYPAIQKPGIYKVQWVMGDLESSVVTFTVTPELEQLVTDPGLVELEMLRKARGAAEQFIRTDAASQRYEPVFQGGSDHGVETWLVYRREMKNGDAVIPNYSIVACNKTTDAVRWIPVE